MKNSYINSNAWKSNAGIPETEIKSVTKPIEEHVTFENKPSRGIFTELEVRAVEKQRDIAMAALEFISAEAFQVTRIDLWDAANKALLAIKE